MSDASDLDDLLASASELGPYLEPHERDAVHAALDAALTRRREQAARVRAEWDAMARRGVFVHLGVRYALERLTRTQAALRVKPWHGATHRCDMRRASLVTGLQVGGGCHPFRAVHLAEDVRARILGVARDGEWRRSVEAAPPPLEVPSGR